MTLDEARQRVTLGLLEGIQCPCCDLYAKAYKRNLNSGMACSLVKMWLIAGEDWVNVPDQIGARSREEGKLRFWGLAEEKQQRRSDGGRAGWWRVTSKGAAFVQDKLRVPKYAYVWNNKLIEHTGPEIGIVDALGTDFDYSELMGLL